MRNKNVRNRATALTMTTMTVRGRAPTTPLRTFLPNGSRLMLLFQQHLSSIHKKKNGPRRVDLEYECHTN